VGETFSVFCADQGIAMICGNRKFAGIDNLIEDVLSPRLIDNLLRENILDVSCGTEHVVVVSEEGLVFVWGNNEDGRLGTGDVEEVSLPRKLDIPTKQLISNVKCGPDCSMLITRLGTIIVMGSNRCNKLNLNYRMGFFANVKNAKVEFLFFNLLMSKNCWDLADFNIIQQKNIYNADFMKVF
jgi:NIMA (never in mitosis gene a)-related kinase